MELRVDGRADLALASLRSHGLAGDDAFAIGSTITVPLHDGVRGDAVRAISTLGLDAAAINIRRPKTKKKNEPPPNRSVILDTGDGFFSVALTVHTRGELQLPMYEEFFNSLGLRPSQ